VIKANKKKIIVLGGGMIGRVIAADLAAESLYAVTIADISAAEERGGEGIDHRCIDLSDSNNVAGLVKNFDLVVGALPSQMGYATMKAVIEAGKDYCDISFMEEDALELDGLAKENGVTVVFDCGVGPGVSNALVGYADQYLDHTESVEIYVGGLPVERRWPFEYKAAFASSDVINEYMRPARFIENGEVVVREALSEPELIDFDGVGTLEAFNTDGLRSLLTTIDAPQRKEKTMRYPGHIELMRVLRHVGYFSEEKISVGVEGNRVSPLELTSALLFPKWRYDEDEADLTVMRIIVSGTKGGEAHRFQWDLHDRYDSKKKQTSMARTTGFPAAIVSRMMVEGLFRKNGVQAPEALAVEDGLVEMLLGELGERGVRYQQEIIKG
jgi:lysine 6-dehydrogenase